MSGSCCWHLMMADDGSDHPRYSVVTPKLWWVSHTGPWPGGGNNILKFHILNGIWKNLFVNLARWLLIEKKRNTRSHTQLTPLLYLVSDVWIVWSGLKCSVGWVTTLLPVIIQLELRAGPNPWLLIGQWGYNVSLWLADTPPANLFFSKSHVRVRSHEGVRLNTW